MGLTAHGLYSLKLHAFEFEEKLLCGKAAAIAGEASVAAYDAVAGSEDRNGVRAVGCAYRPDCLWIADMLGHPAIDPGLPVRDFQQGVPDFFLKLGADEQKRQIECLASPGKIFIKLLCGLCGDLRRDVFHLRIQTPLQSSVRQQPMLFRHPVAKAEFALERPEQQVAAR